jgi:tetratricopeptide (TPR) repeat protein
MRRWLLCSALAVASPAIAADELKFGKAPSWVVPQAVPTDAGRPSEAPVALLLNDQQVRLEPGKTATYSETAMRIQKPEGLAVGNISIPWNPATDTVTVNKLEIHRGSQVIDVLAGGQKFTTMRREAGLEEAMLDGILTANIQPEGLQEGDVIEFATTIERQDPVMGKHVETIFGAWPAMPIQRAHVRVEWPSTMKLAIQAKGLSAPATTRGENRVIEISAADVEPIIPPKGAPPRFAITRLGEATDFTSWADVSRLMGPLYRKAEAIPASGALHDEVEKIRSSTTDQKSRAQMALQLVQGRTRYVALLMGQGGIVPADAETTWSRRFGDCKAKTALLLGILHALGIEAEPLLVQSKLGDAVAERLPMISYFDHVLVRAHVGGKTYYLDGTRTGDTNIDDIEVPDFGWALPVVDNARLVQLVPQILTLPSIEHRVDIDASAGIYTKAPITIDEVYRGDSAVSLNLAYSSATAQQRDEALRKKANGFFDDFAVESSGFKFDKEKRELKLSIKGTARLNWKDSWFYVPTSSVAFNPDFDRTAGLPHDAPLAVDHPRFVKDKATIRLPHGFASEQKLSNPVHETLVGVEYARSETVSGDALTVDSSERSIVPEVPYKEALAAVARLRALDKDDVYLRVNSDYKPTEKDLAELKGSEPQSSDDYFVRAYVELARNRLDDALADLDAGLALDPKHSWALKKRALINIEKQRFPEAEKDLADAASIDPADAEIIAFRGRLAMNKGDVRAASAAFDEALQRDPKNSVGRAGRAGILVQQGKVDEALAELAIALTSDPHNAGVLAQRAEILEYRNDKAGADKDINVALTEEPDNAAVLATKARIAVERKDYATAKEFVTKALARDPNNSSARILQAALAKRDGNGGQALASFDAAVASSPHDATALINRAFANIEAKNFDAAAKDVSAVLALEPKNLRALTARAEVADAKGDYPAEVEALTAVLSASPLNGPMLQARAESYLQLHQFDLALADTDAAMKSGLISPQLRLLRINIFVRKGDTPAVAAEVGQLIKENPSSDFAFVVAGKTYAAIGMRDKAMASFDRAIAIKPYAYIYINRSQIRPYADLGGKLADIDAALKLEPEQEDALVERARLLSRAGKHAEAIELYDQAIKGALDSSDIELYRAIALQRAGRSSEARTAFDSVRAKAKTSNDFKELCRNKAVNDVVLESALEDCRRAASIDPKLPGLNEATGLALLKLGKLRDSLSKLNDAIEAKSGAETFLLRAIVRARLGDLAGAVADAAEAHRLRADVDDRVAEYGLKFEQSSSKAIAGH